MPNTIQVDTPAVNGFQSLLLRSTIVDRPKVLTCDLVENGRHGVHYNLRAVVSECLKRIGGVVPQRDGMLPKISPVVHERDDRRHRPEAKFFELGERFSLAALVRGGVDQAFHFLVEGLFLQGEEPLEIAENLLLLSHLFPNLRQRFGAGRLERILGVTCEVPFAGKVRIAVRQEQNCFLFMWRASVSLAITCTTQVP